MKMGCRKNGPRRSAFTLVEATFSVLLVGGLLVVALDTVGASAVAKQAVSDAAAGRLLAASVMADILRRDYEDPDGSPIGGLELLEVLVERDSYDDVDDYDNLTVAPAQYPDGTVIPGYSDWSYTVDVNLASPSNFNVVALGDSGVKRIQVRVFHEDIEVARFSAVKTGTPQDKPLIEIE
jgi:type II secretory pathway pseudopilin PulG